MISLPLLARLTHRFSPPSAPPTVHHQAAFDSYLALLTASAQSQAPLFRPQPTPLSLALASTQGDKAACRQSERLALRIASTYSTAVSFVPFVGTNAGGSHEWTTNRIYVRSDLGPEARAYILWHEVGHLLFDHRGFTNIPAGDFFDSSGSRSQEYVADAFAALMLSSTLPGPHLLVADTILMRTRRTEIGLEAQLNPDYVFGTDPSWVKVNARVAAFLLSNRALILSQVLLATSIIRSQVALPRTSCVATIPPSQLLFPLFFFSSRLTTT